jgi:HAD superfamily hydrolase (TIGR01662 family)
VGSASSGGIRAAFFDVGEVVIDESSEYGTWADWLGVPRHTFSAMFGAVIARGEDYRMVFEHFRPGFDLEVERTRRLEAGLGEFFNARDLYPDVRPCFAALKERGYYLGVAGNQTARAGGLLRELNLGVDVIATSDDWGVEKPSIGFFERVVSEAGVSADQVLYVGDRMENDILPAIDAGLRTAHLRRGPWGYQQVHTPDTKRADLRLESLEQLPSELDRLNATG